LANVRFGSLADKPSRGKIRLCPLFPNSEQNVAVPWRSTGAERLLAASRNIGNAAILGNVADEFHDS
jgi:hypothetical protein